MIETLRPIWQRLLNRSTINEEDDFFELGGNPFVATKLFREISTATDRELPPVLIYRARTLASQSALLGRPDKPSIPPIVLLKPGNAEKPVFLLHGFAGDLLEFFPLLQHIHLPFTFFGLQAPGTDGLRKPFDRIEDWAQYEWEEVQKVQPKGPYRFIGYSGGGLVALEMARRATEQGKIVALLAMVESYPHLRYVPISQRRKVFRRKLHYHVSIAKQLPLIKAIHYLGRRALASQEVWTIPDSLERSQTMQQKRLCECSLTALRRYFPSYYRGTLRFAKAETSLRFPDDIAKVWSRFVDKLEVEIVPGDHEQVLTKYSSELAGVISRFLTSSS